MKNTLRDANNSQYNSMYYNQMLRASEKKQKKTTEEVDFGSRKIDLNDYLIVMRGYESIFYGIYFICIPYIIGLIFLFFYVAEGAYSNFSLLDLTSFIIIWAIGYEVTGALILCAIFISYIKFLKNSHK